jgi:phytoene synthase
MMLPIMGTADGVTQEEAKRPAIALGIALQITNILRDVGEDLKRGRIYLPLEELRQFGLTEEDLLQMQATGKVTEQYKSFVKFQIARARDYYEEAAGGIAMLAPNARFAVRASLDLYGRILDKIEENGYDNFSKRAYTTGWEKLGILPGSWMKSMQKDDSMPAPAERLVSSSPHDTVWTLGIGLAGVAIGAAVATAVALRHRRPQRFGEPLLC